MEADDTRSPQYEIVVAGHLDQRWADRFDGLSLRLGADGTTLLRGPVADQAALHGLLAKLRDLGLPLISVSAVSAITPHRPAAPITEPHGSPTQRNRMSSENPMTTENPVTTDHTTTRHGRVPMDQMRRIALYGGVAYLITFVTSIPALFLKAPVLDHTDFILGAGSSTSIRWAAVLDVTCALFGIASAVALYPVTRRYGRTGAIGIVASRTLEASIMVVGVISLLSIVTLRQDLAGGSDPAALSTVGSALVAVHDWTFLFGPGVMAGVNALFLASVMYRSRLIPRIIPAMGLVGAPLLLASCIGVVFGGWEQVSSVANLATLPVALWELSLGVWLTFKGFKPSPVADEGGAARTAQPELAV